MSVKPEEKNRAEEIESLRVQLSHIEEQYKLKLGESKALESKVQQLEQSKASLESTVNAQSQQVTSTICIFGNFVQVIACKTTS